MTKIIAHRGYSGKYPENTMLAFEQAIKAGADAIETDVRKTADGVLVIMHDSSLVRVSDNADRINTAIHNSTYDELKKYDISAKNHPDMPGQHIVLFSDLLELIKNSSLELNIEIKANPVKNDGVEYDIMDEVKNFGLSERVYYSCFCHPLLKNIKSRDRNARVAPLYSYTLYKPEEYAKSLGAFAIHPEFSDLLLYGDAAAARQAGLEINTWTVNSAEDAVALVKAGVTGLITNYPEDIRAAAENA